MKKLLSGCIFGLCLMLSCSQPEKIGVIQSGEIWPDDKGVHINAHGGGILFYDDTY